ncbi:MAG: acyl-CoA dehydrogenase, partial [Acidimicrobiia bacterium]
MTAPADLTAAASVLELTANVVGKAVRNLATSGSVDADQVLAYDLAHATAAVATAQSMLDYGTKGDTEARLTCAFAADAVHDVATKLFGREATGGVPIGALDPIREFCATYRDPAYLAAIATSADPSGPRPLDSDFEMVQDTFRRFAEEKIKPRAERVHRYNEDVR